MSGAAQRKAILNLQALPPLALFLLGLAIIWAPGRPAMVDISQHSAEISMWRDLLLGRSAWAVDLRVDLATPYFLGYALALPLAFLMTPLAAIKVVLTAAYAAFGLIGRAVGRELDAPATLDSYYFIPFFSIAWSYGMFPFLVAAPLGLGLIWASLRYARGGGAGWGLLVSALGLATLFSHAFVFAFAMAAGAGLVAISGRPLRRLIPMTWPFIAPSLVCLLLFFHATGSEAASVGHYGLRVHVGPAILRVGALLGGGFDDWTDSWSWSVGLCLYFLPFICGLRIASKRRDAWVIAGVLVAIIALTPLAILEMWIYPRFSMFVLPAYAWLFAQPSTATSRLTGWLTPRIGLFAAVLGGFGLVQHINEQLTFSREARDFDAILAHAAPGRRALSLVYDQHSAVVANPLAYLHFPQWYAVEKGGFVDLSFANDPHEVVRFSHTPPPPYDDVTFEMTNHPGRPVDPARWSYIFVRGRIPPGVFAGCQPVQIAAEGSWRLLEPRPCQPK